jgi:uncharacterized protein YbcV (DUF1398 family)
VEVHKVGGAPEDFSAEGVEKAVRAIQRQEIGYRKFCRLIADAGCVGYFVSLTGRRAVYYGRTGDEDVEWFPGEKRRKKVEEIAARQQKIARAFTRFAGHWEF